MANESPTKGTESDKNLLRDLRKRFKDALDADEEQRRDAIDDMKFAPACCLAISCLPLVA